MKKFLFFSVLLLSVAGFTYKNGDLVSKGLRFVAPGISGKDNVHNPETGEIIFDSSDSQFYGRDDANNWIQFSAAQAILPPGVILPYGGSTAPNGYYLCKGQAITIAGNEDLFAAIGTSFGDGTRNADGTSSGYAAATAFNLPDMRGRFVRGVAAEMGASRDPDVTSRTASNVGGSVQNSVGSVQTDQFRSHTHNFTVGLSGGGSVPANGAGSLTANTTTAAGGSETRPVNIYTNYLIKR